MRRLRRPSRFIPAYTGNTGACCSCLSHFPVHPRVHGEHLPPDLTRAGGDGSSPRTRGTRVRELVVGAVERFIPAYTGNTRRGRRLHRGVAVHPRVHGEHLSPEAADAITAGSSPRTRGTRSGDGPRLGVGRFIPAYTGNTARRPRTTSASPVHPRVHGEHSDHVTEWPITAGSSPRTRGTPHLACGSRPGIRFIPAYTGNTPSGTRPRTRRTVHPRVHGEHADWDEAEFNFNGSSPRTRGTLDQVPLLLVEPRFIPAYTGNTGAP